MKRLDFLKSLGALAVVPFVPKVKTTKTVQLFHARYYFMPTKPRASFNACDFNRWDPEPMGFWMSDDIYATSMNEALKIAKHVAKNHRADYWSIHNDSGKGISWGIKRR